MPTEFYVPIQGSQEEREITDEDVDNLIFAKFKEEGVTATPEMIKIVKDKAIEREAQRISDWLDKTGFK